MTTESEHPDQDALEAMLRTWGHEQACERVELPPLEAGVCEKPAAHRVWWRRAPARWAATAAAVLLGLGVGFWAGSRPESAYSSPAALESEKNDAQQAHRHEQALTAERQAWQAKQKEILAAAETQAREWKKTLAGMKSTQARQTRDLLALRGDLAKARATLATLEGQENADQDKLAAAQKSLAGTQKSLAGTQKSLVETQTALATHKKRSRALLAAAGADRREAISRIKAQQQARERAQQRRMLAIYLRTPAGSPIELPAIQQAVRMNRLLDRAKALRASCRSNEGRAMIDRAEVILTQLSLQNPDDVTRVASLAKLVRSSKLVESLQEQAKDSRTPPAVAKWMTEVALVLSGVSDVA